MMPAITAIIFDAFNTLFRNDHSLWAESFTEVVHAQHLSVDHTVLWDKWKTLESEFRKRRLNLEDFGKSPPFESYQDAWVGCFQRAFAELDLNGDSAAAVQVCLRGLGCRPTFPETLEVVSKLHGSVKLAILSNADDSFLHPLLDRYDLKRYLSYILSSEAGRTYKPHPAIFRQVLASLDIDARAALMVGDTLHEDVYGAQSVGMQTAWVNRGMSPRKHSQPTPDYEVQDLTELLNIVA
jgi:2-haloalkanoic acid dehalogenase type II